MQMQDTKANAKRAKTGEIKIRIDCKDKAQRLKSFLIELNKSRQIKPFLDLAQITRFGVLDFQYFNEKTLSLEKIYSKVKSNSYQFFCDFIRDLTNIFVAVSDYCFVEDELQASCEKFIKKIGQFQCSFIRQFKQKQLLKIESQHESKQVRKIQRKKQAFKSVPVQIQSKSLSNAKKQQESIDNEDAQSQEMQTMQSDLLDKLRMVDWIRLNGDNETAIRQLSSRLKNYCETQTEIIIKIDNSSWQQFLNVRNT